MVDLKKLLAKMGSLSRAKAARESDFGPLPDGNGLEIEYHAIIARQLRRRGVDPESVTLEVRTFGQAGDGRDVFVCFIHMMTWDRVSGLRLLLGLPMLEAKVRKNLATTWLADISHFGGLWLHASQHLHGASGTGELRDLIKQLTPSHAGNSTLTPLDSQPGLMTLSPAQAG